MVVRVAWWWFVDRISLREVVAVASSGKEFFKCVFSDCNVFSI